MKGLLRHFRGCKFWRSFSTRKRWYLMIGLALSLVLFYLVLSMLIVDQTELSLEKLRRSYRREPICHEACAADRETAVFIIIKNLKEQPDSKNARRLAAYLLDEDNEIDFRISLIQIVREVFGVDTPPGYIKDYLAREGNPLLRAAIISSFSAWSLSEIDNPLDYYYEILASDEAVAVKLAAVRELGSTADKENLFVGEHLGHIKKMVFDSKNDQRLRQSLILLLGDYYSVFPDETRDILLAFYKTDISGDAISRAFAADILNRLSGERLVVPEISAAEWEEYYNN